MGKNDKAEGLRYQFTAYLQTAIRRARQDYIKKQIVRQARFTLVEDFELLGNLVCEMDVTEIAPLQEQVEDELLAAALERLSADETTVLRLRVIYELTHKETAEMLGQNFWTTKAAYLRAIRKLREACKGGERCELQETTEESREG